MVSIVAEANVGPKRVEESCSVSLTDTRIPWAMKHVHQSTPNRFRCAKRARALCPGGLEDEGPYLSGRGPRCRRASEWRLEYDKAGIGRVEYCTVQ